MDTIAELDEDWKHITDLKGLQQGTDDNPEGWDQEQLDLEVLQQDRRAKLTAIEQLHMHGIANQVAADTDMTTVGLPDSIEHVEEEEGYAERLVVIARHIAVAFHERMLFKLEAVAECGPYRDPMGCPGP
mmetsp:Transcript_17789/g.49797  ORF Transcript_17789/g.49797 Transcript_17789/m.49797 type:complete len:130 (+) Transcript_17789:242-631(+)